MDKSFFKPKMLATDSLKSVSIKAIHKAAESISQYEIQSEIIQITETATKIKEKEKEKKDGEYT